ncbi:Glutathione transferase FosA [Roseivivax sp. THAF40]|uniref:VOC family protein n=1 Tax=unclassified Roseivivax TaxID=2639302 RepID=UPI001267C587|nr:MULTISPECIES: VOC family protein [unclassified Roseivivax]QFS82685.1 Glutathione transferase FosA [Roseivivax sp. THAF197b]QFT46454.1 Glutathione transferase FosA [Roseivivax sp. THAF40]
MITGLNHLTLAVSDLDRSVAFYRDILGGTPRAASDGMTYMSLGALWLCLEASDEVRPARGGTHYAFSASGSAFEALARRIRGAAPIWKENRSEGASVYFLDPDGHRLELHDGDLDSRLAHYRAHPEKGVAVLS